MSNSPLGFRPVEVSYLDSRLEEWQRNRPFTIPVDPSELAKVLTYIEVLEGTLLSANTELEQMENQIRELEAKA